MFSGFVIIVASYERAEDDDEDEEDENEEAVVFGSGSESEDESRKRGLSPRNDGFLPSANMSFVESVWKSAGIGLVIGEGLEIFN